MSYLERRAGLYGKVAVVTGGAGGLGWPIARDLARAGVHMALCDRDATALDTIAPELDAMPVRTLRRHADVRDPAAMAAFFDEIDAQFGRIDILVDVPGGGFVAPLMRTTPNGWQAIIRQNFLYVLDTTQHAVRRMQAQGTGGSIVYVTSIEAHRAVPNRAVYGAMKAGVASLAKSLALELGASGIRVNTVAPDVFPTPASGGGVENPTDPTDPTTTTDPDNAARAARQASIAIPMRRFGTGEDLSGGVLFLASDLARYVTGTTLHIDGGTDASSGWFDYPDDGWSVMPIGESLDAIHRRAGGTDAPARAPAQTAPKEA